MLKDECILVDEEDRIVGHATKQDCHRFEPGQPKGKKELNAETGRRPLSVPSCLNVMAWTCFAAPLHSTGKYSCHGHEEAARHSEACLRALQACCIEPSPCFCLIPLAACYFSRCCLRSATMQPWYFISPSRPLVSRSVQPPRSRSPRSGPTRAAATRCSGRRLPRWTSPIR
jgi:hypothetical protein